MKNFFRKLLGRKYPDRNGDSSRKMGRVYAGPDSKRFPSSAEGVYAGPPHMNNANEPQKNNPVADDEPMECVYAGPPVEEEEEIRQIRLVYAGPPASLDPVVDDVEIEEVYNGPGMMDEIGWEIGGEPEEDPVEDPEEDVDPDTVTDIVAEEPSADPVGPSETDDARDVNSMLMAYAGPAMWNPNLLDPLMVAAYAGPNMMNNQMFQMQDPGMPMAMMAYFGPGGPSGPVPAGMMSVMPNVEETPDPSKDLIREEHKVCPVCGKILHPNTKFCPDCGMDMTKEPVQEGMDI